MTVIAGRIYKCSIDMSCDSQTTSGRMKFNGKGSGNLDGHAKIFVKNGMMIGSAGFTSESKLMQLFAENHKPKEATEEGILEYIVEFYDRAKKKKSDFEKTNHYLIAFEGKLFFFADYVTQEVSDFAAIGSGMGYALAAMYLGKSTKEACTVASKFDLHCSGKIECYSVTKSSQKKKK